MTDNSSARPLDERRTSARAEAAPGYVERRNEIIEAARAVFRDKGLQAATFKDVAEACGGDRATVYYYFKNKNELFREIALEHVLSNVTHAEQVARRRGLTPPERLREVIADLMDSYERHYPDLFIFIQEDMSKLKSEKSDWADEMRELSRRYDRTVEGIIADGVRRGEFSTELSPRIVAYAIIGMLSWSHRWYRPATGSARAIGEGLADVLLGGLLTARPNGTAAAAGGAAKRQPRAGTSKPATPRSK